MTKINPSQAKPGTPAPVPSAEPAEKELLLQVNVTGLEGLLTKHLFAFKLPASLLPKLDEAIARAVEDLPKVETVIGRPPRKLIVVAVNKADPTFTGGENAFDLGEVISLPLVVEFFNSIPNDKTSPGAIDYYTDRSKPFEKYGYTFRTVEDFKKQLDGPTKRDIQEIFDAHCALQKASRKDLFE